MSFKSLFGEHLISTAVLVALVSGITSFATTQIQSRASQEAVELNAETKIIEIATNTITKENNRLIKRVADLEAKVDGLIKESLVKDKRIHEMETIIGQQFDKVKTLNAFPQYMPGPAWMKDVNSRMLLLNDAYTSEWSISRWRYVGKLDKDVWPEMIAEQFVENDQEVIKCECPIRTYEQVPKYALKPISAKNPLKWWVIWKWPVVKDNKIFGLAGAAFEPSEVELNALEEK